MLENEVSCCQHLMAWQFDLENGLASAVNIALDDGLAGALERVMQLAQSSMLSVKKLPVRLGMSESSSRCCFGAASR